MIFEQLLKKNIKSIFFIIIGIFWLILFLYLRFGISKSSYSLIELKSQITLQYLIIHIGFVFLHIGLILYAIYILLLKNKKTSNKIVKKISNIITFIIAKPLEHLRDFIAPYIPYSGSLFCNLALFLQKNDYDKITKLIVILFNIIPRILVSIIFFIELVFYNKIYYFIPSLFLLLIPLIWNLFRNLFTNFGIRALNDIRSYIKIIPIGESKPNGFYEDYLFEPLDKYDYEPNEINEYGSLWFLAINIYGFGELYFKQFQETLTPYVTIFCSSLYLFATVYKISFLFM